MTTETPTETPTGDAPASGEHPLEILHQPQGGGGGDGGGDDTVSGAGGEDTVSGGGGDGPGGEPGGAPTPGKTPAEAGKGGEPAAGEGGEPTGDVTELTFAPEQGYGRFSYPDGVPIDQALETSFMETARKLNGGKGLSQEDAQQLVNFQATQIEGWLRTHEAGVAAAKETCLRDPRYGGAKAASSAQHVDEILRLVENQAIEDNFEPAQGLRKRLEETGFFWDAGVQRLLALTGSELTGEPGPPAGTRVQSEAPKDLTTHEGRAAARQYRSDRREKDE